MCSYGKLKGKLQLSDTSLFKMNQTSSMRAIWELFPFVFRINDNNIPGQTTLTILQKVCKERGWREYNEDDDKLPGGNILGWNLWWRSVVMMHTQRSLYSWQYTNHIPKAVLFCNKEYLASYVRIMEDRFGLIFHFCPRTFTLPREREELEMEHEARSRMDLLQQMSNSVKNLVHVNFTKDQDHNEVDADGDKSHSVKEDESTVKTNPGELNSKKYGKPLWICKPVGKSQGKGIFLIDDLTNLPDHPVTIVQEYISRPLLISGYKFDLRLYVTIVSVSPLTIYAYREGLTRFATEPYDLKDLSSICSHLTNSSLNKLSPGYEKDKEVVGHGCKWTLRKLRQYLAENGDRDGKPISDWLMWQRIMSIIVLTILGEVGQHVGIPFLSTKNNFEFLGYDILIDEDLQPWLLEANLSAGLGGDCEVDEIVKKPMLHDLFDLLGLPDSRPYLSLVPVSSLHNNDVDDVIVIDQISNTALKFTSEAEIFEDPSRDLKLRPSSSSGTGTGRVANEFNHNTDDDNENGHQQSRSRSAHEQSLVQLAKKTVKKQQQNFKPKVNSKEKISPQLLKRLLDATSIYSQNLATTLMPQNLHKPNRRKSLSKLTPQTQDQDLTSVTEAARLNFLASTDWVGTANMNFVANNNSSLSFREQIQGQDQGAVAGSIFPIPVNAQRKPRSTIPHRPGIGLQRRSWYDAPQRHGDWIRIFPFDTLSFQMTRGHFNTDIKAIVNRMNFFLKMAEELVSREPMKSDDYYRRTIAANVSWSSELWLPPK